MKKLPSITSLPESPDDDLHRRMRRYLIAMGIRMACIVACLFTPGWWIVVPILGAVLLPYIAVVLANESGGKAGVVERPGSIVPLDKADGQ